jgi:hypothetical protein
VLIGKCTGARLYIDWEIQASPRHCDVVRPNGLIGIVLPSAAKKPNPPERFLKNIKGNNMDEGYARYHWYPQRKDQLTNWVEDAFQARTNRAYLIENPRDNQIH